MNDERGMLERTLPVAWDVLAPGGRLGVISFHSGEDRVVKNFVRDLHRSRVADVLTKKPIRPGAEEAAAEPALPERAAPRRAQAARPRRSAGSGTAGRGDRVKTMSMVVAICLVGSLLATGAFWRSERVRSRLPDPGAPGPLAHARNENEWLRGRHREEEEPARDRARREARRPRPASSRTSRSIVVVPRDHSEVPGS